MRNLWMAALVALSASTFSVGTAFAQECVRDIAQKSQGEIWKGDICEGGPLGSTTHAICGRDHRWTVPYTGQDQVFKWTVPETGRWDIKGSGAGLNALQIAFDATLNCTRYGRLLAVNNGGSNCSTGSDIGYSDWYLEKGWELAVIADSKPGTCGEVLIEAIVQQSCEASAQDLGSEVGDVVTRHATGADEATQIIRTTCGGNHLPVGQRSNTERLSERLYKWTAPAAGTYNFLAESAGNGVTMAILEDATCPESGNSHHDKCQTINSSAGVPVSRTITLQDMTEGQEIIIVIKQRMLDRPMTFDLSISEDICTTTEATSDLILDSKGADANVLPLTPGSPFQGPECAPTTGETKHILWEAPFSGVFSFTDPSSSGYANLALEVREGKCDGKSLGCDSTVVKDVALEKGEQVVISLGRSEVGGGSSNDYKLEIAGVGCGDGVLTEDSGEQCDYAGDESTWECPTSHDIGTAGCTDTCEIDTRECFGDCDKDTSCDERPGAETVCNPDQDCFYVCEDGFADCDDDLNADQGEPSNGCEVKLDDLDTCGTCDQRCGADQTCEADTDSWSCVGETTCYVDADGDGYGVGDGTTATGNCPPGTSPYDGDCDDTDENVHPGAAEICNGIDDNCNGEIDEDNPNICPDIEGAVGVCEAVTGETPRCAFSCEDGLIAIDGDAQNGCSVDGTDPGDGDGDGDGDGSTTEDGYALGGGRGFGTCSAAGSSGMAPVLLALLGLALVGRSRRRAA